MSLSEGVLQSQNTELKIAQLQRFLEPGSTRGICAGHVPNTSLSKYVTIVNDSSISETPCLSSMKCSNFSHS